jgi:hypothetical protein
MYRITGEDDAAAFADGAGCVGNVGHIYHAINDVSRLRRLQQNFPALSANRPRLRYC